MMPGGYGRGRGRGLGRGGPGGPGGFGRGFGRIGIPSGPNVGPIPPGAMRVAAAVLNDSGLSSQISPRFARAPYMAFVDLKGGQVVSLKILPNPFMSVPRGAGVGTAQWLISNGVSAVLAVNLGPNMAFVLQQAGVKIIPVGMTTLEAALRASGFLS